MILSFFISYNHYSLMQRRLLGLFLSILFLSLSETKIIVQSYRQMMIAQIAYQSIKKIEANQNKLIRQTTYFIEQTKKLQHLLQTNDNDSDDAFIQKASRAQIFTLHITPKANNQYILNGSAPWQAWRNLFVTLTQTQTNLKPIALEMLRNAENNLDVSLQFELDSALLNQNKYIVPTETPASIEWIGLLKKGSQCFAFLKQPNQVITGLLLGEYLPKTQWKIIQCGGNQLILENSVDHKQYTQDFT